MNINEIMNQELSNEAKLIANFIPSPKTATEEWLILKIRNLVCALDSIAALTNDDGIKLFIKEQLLEIVDD